MSSAEMSQVLCSPSLERNAKIVRSIVGLGAAALCLQPLLLLVSDETGLVFFAATGLLGLPGFPEDLGTRWRTAVVSLVPVGGALYALWQLWRLFGEYGQGRVFGQAAQRLLVRFSWAVLVLALVLPFLRGVMSVAFSLANPPGQRYVQLSFEWFDYLQILLGLVLVSIASVMAEAARLADDNAGFV